MLGTKKRKSKNRVSRIGERKARNMGVVQAIFLELRSTYPPPPLLPPLIATYVFCKYKFKVKRRSEQVLVLMLIMMLLRGSSSFASHDIPQRTVVTSFFCCRWTQRKRFQAACFLPALLEVAPPPPSSSSRPRDDPVSKVQSSAM